VVYHQYSGIWAKYMRGNEFEGYCQRLHDGDTLTIGVDYYALTGISSMYFRGIEDEMVRELRQGKVMVFQISNKFVKRIL
jgi:hypothetical protein